MLNKHDNTIEGMRGEDQIFSPLTVPDEYRPLADAGLDVSNFGDAIRQHEIIDRMFDTSAATFG